MLRLAVMNAIAQVQQSMQERKLTIASELDNLSQIEEFIEQLQEDFRVKEDVYGNILVTVTEAVNNAIKHGNRLDPDKSVTVRAQLHNPFLLTVSIKDEGSGFDPLALPDPTLPENRLQETGRGIFFMKQLADKAAFKENGTLIELTFNI